MFKKILVANRGESACRVIRTARRMGIATVAIYSSADRQALHVEMADEAIAIGPPPAAESYLSIERIVNACLRSGAEAVHPGYGFLAENAAFARALADAGVVFIGPPPSAIEAVGDKIESKRFAEQAGLRVVPGHLDAIPDAEEAARIAAGIGYPVMIKAAAGGGGKGMRAAYDKAEALEGFELASSEARSAFGDARVFIEKLIEEPRHIEIQVLADRHGNVAHLGERECSIQRRHQKIVEEAPSAFLDAGARAEMGAGAAALARAVGYLSAGTVEFIVDRERNFFFLEMNARLQVEHPVTELVTGLDLVEAMIRVAAGEPLGFREADVRLDGWAVECRIYAEDPHRGFLPSVGRLTQYRPPAAGRFEGVTIRNDTGVAEGSEISVFYDPMIAKLCTHAPDRAKAIEAMAGALDEFVIDGVRHNIPFLSELMAHPRWREARLSTDFISDEFPAGLSSEEESAEGQAVLSAIAVSALLAERRRMDGFSERLRPCATAPRSWVLALGNKRIPMEIHAAALHSPLSVELSVDDHGKRHVVTDWRPGERHWRGMIDGASYVAQIRRDGHGLAVAWRGLSRRAVLLSPSAAALAALMPAKTDADASRTLRCPMPGVIVGISVKEGQTVARGATLAVVEAMKMENVLRAERDVTIRRVIAAKGDSLPVDAPIMEFV